MQCKHCNAQLNEDARFCNACGAAVNETRETNVSASPETAAGSDAVHAAQAFASPAGTSDTGAQNSAGSAEFVKQLESTAKNYFSYIKSCLAQPAAYSRTVNGEQMVNGIINMVLLCIFAAIVLGKAIYATISLVLDPFAGLLGGYARPSFADVFVKPLFLMLLLTVIVIAAIYLACKLMQSDANWKDIVARFGAFLSVPTVLFLAAAFFALINAGQLTILVMAIGMFGLCTAMTLTLNSLKREGSKGLDIVYGVLVAYAITGVGYYLLAAILI